jgi:hypothetical protein
LIEELVMGWFSRKPTTEKQAKTAAKVASNLYLLTIPGGEDAIADLQFIMPDSRFRYLLFCMSATAAACATAIDINAIGEAVFAMVRMAVQERSAEFFGGTVNEKDVLKAITPRFQWLMNGWAKCVELEQERRVTDVVEMIAVMMHSAESPLPATAEDTERLGPLALQIHCRMAAMCRAFKEELGL